MAGQYNDSTLTIDLGAIGNNYLLLKNKITPAICGAVVKADSYGLGADIVSSHLYDLGCNDFFVANIEEALSLRKSLNTKANIYVFGGIREKQEDIFIHNNIIPVLNTEYEIYIWNKFTVNLDYKPKAVIHIDTGMNRLGIKFEYAINNINLFQSINIDFFITHMACADDVESEYNKIQLDKFSQFKELFPDKKFSLANSSSIFLGADYHFDIARPGSALYGVNPTPHKDNPMHNVINLDSKIIQINSYKKGEYIGYSSSYKLNHDSVIATIPIGYADGYLRSLSNNSYVYINGNKAPLVGRVSMDLITIDITNISKEFQQVGQVVEIIGNNITVDDLANQAGTIGYEILTSLGSRFKRSYISKCNK